AELGQALGEAGDHLGPGGAGCVGVGEKGDVDVVAGFPPGGLVAELRVFEVGEGGREDVQGAALGRARATAATRGQSERRKQKPDQCSTGGDRCSSTETPPQPAHLSTKPPPASAPALPRLPVIGTQNPSQVKHLVKCRNG